MAEARRHEQAQLDGDLDGDNQSENSVNTAVTSVSNLAIQVCTVSLTVHTVVFKCTYFRVRLPTREQRNFFIENDNFGLA